VDAALAWVESPFQLVAAAEWAAARDERIAVAMRISGRQMTSTAEELLRRGAPLSITPYFGVPWGELVGHGHWSVGDAYSGQFRLAASTLRPKRMTLLDDGAQTVALADSLLGRRPFARPGQTERPAHGFLGDLARQRMLGLAARGRLELATTFPLGDERIRLLGDGGATVTPLGLDWVRRTARPIAVPGGRVLLGSALPVDQRMSQPAYLAWVGSHARADRLAYLPHRRETPDQLAAVAAISGVTVHDLGLPIELVLAGATEALEIITLPTSAGVTLGRVLAGTGSTIRTDLTALSPV
jgi:hypothetical protein